MQSCMQEDFCPLLSDITISDYVKFFTEFDRKISENAFVVL